MAGDADDLLFPRVPFWDPDERGYTSPLYAPSEWDRCMIGGQKVPGIVDTSGMLTIKTHTAKPSGKSGARTTTTGREPNTGEIKVYISTPEQWAVWQTIQPRLTSGQSAETSALDVYSPQFAMLDIKAIVVTAISTPQPGRIHGERMISIRVVEYLPIAKKVSTASKSGSKSDDSKPPELERSFRPDGSEVNFTPDNATQSVPSEDGFTANP